MWVRFYRDDLRRIVITAEALNEAFGPVERRFPDAFEIEESALPKNLITSIRDGEAEIIDGGIEEDCSWLVYRDQARCEAIRELLLPEISARPVSAADFWRRNQ